MYCASAQIVGNDQPVWTIYNTLYENNQCPDQEGKYVKKLYFCLKTDIPASKGKFCYFLKTPMKVQTKT
jgi:hypothetical protein